MNQTKRDASTATTTTTTQSERERERNSNEICCRSSCLLKFRYLFFCQMSSSSNRIKRQHNQQLERMLLKLTTNTNYCFNLAQNVSTNVKILIQIELSTTRTSKIYGGQFRAHVFRSARNEWACRRRRRQRPNKTRAPIARDNIHSARVVPPPLAAGCWPAFMAASHKSGQ